MRYIGHPRSRLAAQPDLVRDQFARRQAKERRLDQQNDLAILQVSSRRCRELPQARGMLISRREPLIVRMSP